MTNMFKNCDSLTSFPNLSKNNNETNNSEELSDYDSEKLELEKNESKQKANLKKNIMNWFINMIMRL